MFGIEQLYALVKIVLLGTGQTSQLPLAFPDVAQLVYPRPHKGAAVNIALDQLPQ